MLTENDITPDRFDLSSFTIEPEKIDSLAHTIAKAALATFYG